MHLFHVFFFYASLFDKRKKKSVTVILCSFFMRHTNMWNGEAMDDGNIESKRFREMEKKYQRKKKERMS